MPTDLNNTQQTEISDMREHCIPLEFPYQYDLGGKWPELILKSCTKIA